VRFEEKTDYKTTHYRSHVNPSVRPSASNSNQITGPISLKPGIVDLS